MGVRQRLRLCGLLREPLCVLLRLPRPERLRFPSGAVRGKSIICSPFGGGVVKRQGRGSSLPRSASTPPKGRIQARFRKRSAPKPFRYTRRPQVERIKKVFRFLPKKTPPKWRCFFCYIYYFVFTGSVSFETGTVCSIGCVANSSRNAD